MPQSVDELLRERQLIILALNENRSKLNNAIGIAIYENAAHLSKREGQVFELLLWNKTNKEIASALNISERTAKFHVSQILAKHNVKSRYDLLFENVTQQRKNQTEHTK